MRLTAAIAIVALLPLSSAMADVYRSVDAQGHVLYSDSPTPGAELIRGGRSNVPISQTSSLTAAPKPAAMPAKTADASPTQNAESQVAADNAARTVKNDVAQQRAEQCKQAKDAYNKSITARRIYNVAPDGTRTYLTDAEAEKNRVDNKLQMDQLCGGG
ncbi:MAG TPA: DUF4124 domain-containing protein [Steroidobacteraceae bacterium]|jgi:hypothetical protein|nr:DUF4124 domain-containing protein [Steroidobacteraceae bacterium]